MEVLRAPKKLRINDYKVRIGTADRAASRLRRDAIRSDGSGADLHDILPSESKRVHVGRKVPSSGRVGRPPRDNDLYQLIHDASGEEDSLLRLVPPPHGHYRICISVILKNLVAARSVALPPLHPKLRQNRKPHEERTGRLLALDSSGSASLPEDTGKENALFKK